MCPFNDMKVKLMIKGISNIILKILWIKVGLLLVFKNV